MKNVRNLNMKHLRYFTEVARRGSVVAAARALHVTPQTVSVQIQLLEGSVGQPLFDRVGKRLLLTSLGTAALEYASEIFALSDELGTVLIGGSRPQSFQLRVGVTDNVPKLLTVAALSPVIEAHRSALELVCDEGRYADLLGRVVAGELDMLLAEAAVPVNLSRALQATLLTQSGISFLAAPSLRASLTGRFPRNLHEAPYLAGSTSHSLTAQNLEAWFARHQVRPKITGRIDDSAMLKGFAQNGLGVIAVPASIEKVVTKQYGLALLGRTNDIKHELFLIRARVRKPNPMVAILEEFAGERALAGAKRTKSPGTHQ